MRDALKVARERLSAVDDFKERQPENIDMHEYLDGSTYTVLASAVIAQHAELAKLRPIALLSQDEYDTLVAGHRASIVQVVELQKLRAGLTQAIEYLDDANRRGDWKEEIAELRKLVP